MHASVTSILVSSELIILPNNFSDLLIYDDHLNTSYRVICFDVGPLQMA